MSLLVYPGRAPSNVSKDAKYSIKHGSAGMEVTLLYQIGPRERELLATTHHGQLVDAVNEVKTAANGVPGGAFYINEFHDVIVPSTSGTVYFAGFYDQPLEFNLDGKIVSAVAPASLKPGDEWPGPLAGVAYVLTAGADDIYYKHKQGRRETQVCLSDSCGVSRALHLAQRLARVKGTAGGRIYINEQGEFFDPATNIYLGSIEDDPWFPPPDIPGRP